MYVCACVCVCVCGYVCVYVCVMQDVSKTKNLLSLERVAGGHQKATESEIRTHIGNTLKKNYPFQEGGLKKRNPVGVNAVETETFSYVNVVKVCIII